MSTTAPMSVDARRAALTKALRKYSSEGYAVQMSPDGLQATLTRKRKLNLFLTIILALITAGLWLLVLLFQVLNRKTETVVLYVDEAGKVLRA